MALRAGGRGARCVVGSVTRADENVALIKSDLSWAELAAIPETYAASARRFFIRGATSSFGQAAVNMAVNAGARVIASTRSKERFSKLEALGVVESDRLKAVDCDVIGTAHCAGPGSPASPRCAIRRARRFRPTWNAPDLIAVSRCQWMRMIQSNSGSRCRANIECARECCGPAVER